MHFIYIVCIDNIKFVVSTVVEGFLAISPMIYDVHKTNANHNIHQLLSKNNNVAHVHKATRLTLKSSNNGNNGISNIGRSIIIASSLSIAGLLASIGTIYSEITVIQTGCGPPLLPNTIERSCYLCVLVIAGSSIFLRIVTGSGLADAILVNTESQDDKDDKSLQLFRLVEYLSLLAVLGAFISLGSQTINGEQMDGMSGINVEMCKAIQQS